MQFSLVLKSLKLCNAIFNCKVVLSYVRLKKEDTGSCFSMKLWHESAAASCAMLEVDAVTQLGAI